MRSGSKALLPIVSGTLSFATEPLDVNSLCDWLNNGGTSQKSLKHDECPLDSCKEAVSVGMEEGKLSGTGIDNGMRARSLSETDCCVYKRRKLQRNNVELESAYTVIDSVGTLDDKIPSISKWHHLEKPSDVSCAQINNNTNLVSGQHVLPSVGEEKMPADTSLCNLQNSSSRSNLGHSTTPIVVSEPLWRFSSLKELCISVLQSHGLLGELCTGVCSSLEVVGAADANGSQSCKICCQLGNPLKMLICDLCEEAFHMSCCTPRVKKPELVDEWYCQSCCKTNPMRVKKNSTKKSSEIKTCTISDMLRKNKRYTSRVRIGKDFQVEVPEWSGPVFDDYSYFDEPMKLDPDECASLEVRNFNKTPSIGNWLQCKYVDVNDEEGTECGKWRRAPLTEVQTDKWDCSCALVWDAIHADCAVPQELETDIILKHLTYIKELRTLLSSKEKTDQTRSIGPG